MFRQLQARADNLAESLLISQLEMRRARTLANRMQAIEEFGAVIERIDALRRDAELLHAVEKDTLLDDLDRKVTSVMRSAPFRIVSWFTNEGAKLSWLVGPLTTYPLSRSPMC
jgi:hypothetical protein